MQIYIKTEDDLARFIKSDSLDMTIAPCVDELQDSGYSDNDFCIVLNSIEVIKSNYWSQLKDLRKFRIAIENKDLSIDDKGEYRLVTLFNFKAEDVITLLNKLPQELEYLEIRFVPIKIIKAEIFERFKDLKTLYISSSVENDESQGFSVPKANQIEYEYKKFNIEEFKIYIDVGVNGKVGYWTYVYEGKSWEATPWK